MRRSKTFFQLGRCCLRMQRITILHRGHSGGLGSMRSGGEVGGGLAIVSSSRQRGR